MRAVVLASLPTLRAVLLEMGSFHAIETFVVERIGVLVSWQIQFALATVVLFGPGHLLLPL